jgi:hypothetical protein
MAIRIVAQLYRLQLFPGVFRKHARAVMELGSSKQRTILDFDSEPGMRVRTSHDCPCKLMIDVCAAHNLCKFR